MAYTWSLVNPGFSIDGAAIAWLGDRFIVLGYNQSTCGTSAAGSTWASSALPSARRRVTYPAVYNGNVCSPAALNAVVLYGNDVDGWAEGTLPNSTFWTGAAVDPATGIFVAVSNGSTQAARTTTPAGTWDAITLPAAANCIRFGGSGAGYFLAVRGTTWMKSTDGSDGSWTSGTLPITNAWSLAWNGNVWVALGSDGTVATSPDGENWIDRGTVGTGSAWYTLIAKGTELLAFLDSTGTYARSVDDGASWAELDDGTTGHAWNGAAHDGVSTVLVATTNGFLRGVSDTPLGGGGTTGSGTETIAEGVALAETLTPAQVARLIENLRATGSPTGRIDAHRTLTDNTRFADAMQIVWRMVIAENLTTSAVASENLKRVAAIVDTLRATGVVSTMLDAKSAVAEVLALSTLLMTGWKATAVESLAFQEALSGALRVAAQIVEAATLTDTGAPALRLLAVHADSVAVGETTGTQLAALAALSEDVLLYAVIRLGDSEYVGWVLNEGAPSQYTNYPFNGFLRLDGGAPLYVGTAEDGVYLLEGDDDAGEDITASIKTALMDFGAGVLKRVPEVLIAFTGDDQVVLKVITTHPRTGGQIESIYTASVPPGDALHNAPIKPGQGLVSRYWQFALSEFKELDELTFRPLFLDRRI